MRTWHGVLPAAALLSLAACQDSAAPSPFSNVPLGAALAAAPAGYGEVASSYVGGTADDASADSVGGFSGGRERRMRRDALMGGGIAGAFLGGIGFGRGFGHHGPFGGGLRCEGVTFADGRVTCPPVTRHGLTITRSAAYADASGAVQQAFDSVTTNTVNLRAAVTGTLTFTARDGDGAEGARDGRDGRRGHHGRPGALGRLLGDTARILSATIQVDNASDRTVSGLAQGSTQRTVSGTSRGVETTTGTSSRGEFTATRTIADTTTGLVVPVQLDRGAYPTAGTVVRTMTASLAYAGASRSVSRREVVTYDGSATAHITITENGTTRSCTRALPRGALTCE